MTQLFTEHGKPKVTTGYYKPPSMRQERGRRFIAEMQGEGWIRFHPRTRKWYEIRGDGVARVAYPYPCQSCGITVYRSRMHVRKKGTPTCSGCKERPVGSTREDGRGYTFVKTHDGWKPQHRVVMEQAIGRALTGDETVHHINGQRDDNRLENLQLRRGQHGSGQAHRCLDCGSHNITPVELDRAPA